MSASLRRAMTRGMTLIELLVAMVIGLGLTLAITSLLITGENHRRTTTSVNDAEQTGAYAFYALDRAVRNAGSSLIESEEPQDHGLLGCRLNVAANGATILPRNTPFPAPFTNNFMTGATANLRVTPVLIGNQMSDDGKSDVIMVMGGSGSAGGVSRQITNAGTGTTVILDNSVGFFVNDLALVSQSGVTDCLLEEVQATPAVGATTINVNGAPYYTANGLATNLATLSGSTSSYVTPLGNTGANTVQLLLFGVDANHILYSYDMLQTVRYVEKSGTRDTSQAIADGVYQMHALYGIDSDGDGLWDTWAGPGEVNWDPTSVMTGQFLNMARMRSILALRVALLVRSEYPDKTQVSPASYTIFSGLTDSLTNAPLQQIITLSADDRYYRYRVFEFTVPLRNMLLLDGAPK